MAPSVRFLIHSWFLGLLDLLYYLLRFIPSSKPKPKFFSLGWGDVTAAQRVEAEMTALASAPVITVSREELPAPRKPAKGSKNVSKKGDEAEGKPAATKKFAFSFASPLAAHLPDEVKICDFLFIAPADAVDDDVILAAAPSEVQRIVGDIAIQCDSTIVLLAATGEATKRLRESLARQLCACTRACVIIPTAPFYAKRQPKAQRTYHVTTVADLILQSSAAMSEAAAIACWVAGGVAASRKATPATNKAHTICLSGFSWGGAMAGGGAVLAAKWLPSILPPLPAREVVLAAAPYCGSASPYVLADGILAGDVEFTKLGGVAAKPKLVEVLRQTHLKNLLRMESVIDGASITSISLIKAAVVTSAAHDSFVAPQHSTEYQTLWRTILPAAELRWIPGGHATAFLKRKTYQLDAIMTALRKAVAQV